ncbi:MAG: hypothetical protein ACFE0Q_21560 [Anaerolineae bacterium]
MRIDRNSSRTIFRRKARGGCLSWLVTSLILCVFVLLSMPQIQTLFSRWRVTTPELATLADSQQAFQNGDLERTISYARAVYENDSTRTEALELLVRALVYNSYADLHHEDDRITALDLTTIAVAESPYDMRVLGAHAFALQANGISDQAQRVALRVIRNDENSITARLALALSYSSQGIFEAGLNNALRAVEIANNAHPDWRADAHRVTALLYSDLGRYAEAASSAETAITFNRRLLPIHFERALYAQQIGDMDTATAYYFNVIAFDEDNVKARFRLCEVSSLLGERDAAIDWCGQVVELMPGWADGWYWLGREYYLNGDWRNTQITLNRCSTLQIAQAVPVEDRRFECWYLQGQAAEVLADCVGVVALYTQYQQMAQSANLSQRWVYPDGAPPICQTPTVYPVDG